MQILNCCHPNALLTLKEFLVDYASDETRKVGQALISREINRIKSDKVKSLTEDYLQKIEQGSRDFRFWLIFIKQTLINRIWQGNSKKKLALYSKKG